MAKKEKEFEVNEVDEMKADEVKWGEPDVQPELTEFQKTLAELRGQIADLQLRPEAVKALNEICDRLEKD